MFDTPKHNWIMNVMWMRSTLWTGLCIRWKIIMDQTIWHKRRTSTYMPRLSAYSNTWPEGKLSEPVVTAIRRMWTHFSMPIAIMYCHSMPRHKPFCLLDVWLIKMQLWPHQWLHGRLVLEVSLAVRVIGVALSNLLTVFAFSPYFIKEIRHLQ